MELCKHEVRVKNGKSRHGKQRYKCKECGKTFGDDDGRVKHSMELKLRAIKYYLRGVGIRAIAEVEGVSPAIVLSWVRSFGKLLEKHLRQVQLPKDAKNIQILELEEMFSFVEKKLEKSIYGLLLIGSEIRLLTLK